jgi:SAM-dependent methyltransferase
MDLVEQKYWDESYKDFHFYIPNDAVTRLLDRYSASEQTEVFEIGCFPGRYLAHLGKKGMTVSGMDLAPETETALVQWMQSQKIQTGFIKQGDVLKYISDTQDKYPFVCSFGFIEHFRNFKEIIQLHARVTAKNGLLIITTPNFRGGIQRFLHTNLDKENLKRHYLPSMRPDIWKSLLEENGFTIQFAGYFGGFDFWYDRQKRNFFQKSFAEITRRVIVPLLSWLPSSKSYSPYCAIVAKKIK